MNIRTFSCLCYALCLAACGWAQGVSFSGNAPQAVSAPFAGVSGNYLLLAGGCNFPDVPASEGGVKQYYTAVWAKQADQAWRCVGSLPEETAYGASITLPEGVLCLGGLNANGAMRAVYLLRIEDSGRLARMDYPPLPVSMDNFAAAYAEGKVYVTGGNQGGKPGRTLYALDLETHSWEALPAFPGAARVQPVLLATSDALYLAGGFEPGDRDMPPQLSADLLRYAISQQEWERVGEVLPLADSPRTLTGGYGVAWGDTCLLFGGGVNWQRFADALDRPRQLYLAEQVGDAARADSIREESANYLRHPVAWYRFNPELLAYHIPTGVWRVVDVSPQYAKAGAVCVVWNGKVWVLHGEIKPGVRTAEMVSVNAQTAEK